MDRVIPMLPRRLCEELCSLQPGGARLTFSFIWDLSPVRARSLRDSIRTGSDIRQLQDICTMLCASTSPV